MTARSGRLARRARRGAFVPFLASLSAFGCKGADVPVDVRDPESVLDESAWAQVLVFDDACPPLGDVVLGTYGPARYEQTADSGEGFKDIGSIDAGPVGFALVARTSDCKVIGVGCTNVNLREVDRVDIVVGRVYDTAARTACESTCVEGQCVSADAIETGAGAGSSGPLSPGRAGASRGSPRSPRGSPARRPRRASPSTTPRACAAGPSTPSFYYFAAAARRTTS